jgi:hypothetical protein
LGATVRRSSPTYSNNCASMSADSQYIKYINLSVIEMDESEDPYVIAALLTYLYMLDYADEGPQMSFGLPSDPNAVWLDGIGVDGGAILPEYTEEDEAPLIEWEETGSESEFNFAPDVEVAADILGKDIERPKLKDDGWEALSQSSTARKTPSPSHCGNTERGFSSIVNDRDPGKPITPLALHVQMYKAGLRFEIPCLVSHALKKLEDWISLNFFGNGELIEAADYAWEEHEEPNSNADYTESMGLVRTRILAQVKVRWESIKVRDGFEELVLRKPAFGRDVLRIV